MRKFINTVLCSSLLIGLLLPAQSALAAEEDEVLYWVAPMDANYRRDKPGKSPMGMDLVPVYANDKQSGSGIAVSPAVVQNLGLRTAMVEQGRLWRGIDTVGYIDYDESMVSHIHLRTEGWIEHLATHAEGERVRKGEKLLELYSPELVNAQSEFVQALKLKNQSMIQASRERLRALGVPDKQINQLKKTRKVRQTITLLAPHDGVVSKLSVRHGMFIKPDKQVMTLANLSSVWLLVEVLSRQADWVAIGQTAEVQLPTLPGKTWQGEVEYIYPSLDPKTRTLKVRLRFDNPDEALKPNMYANVMIYGGPKNDIVYIPTEGLIRTGRNERVIVALDNASDEDPQFEAREVVSGMESGDYIEITRGLIAGERIVTSGQFLIDSEASMRGSLTRLGAGQ